MSFRFTVLKQSSKSRARVGLIETGHGVVETPGFVPVATNGTVKAVDPVMADEHGSQLTFCNTYHLMLQPGAPLVEKMGGLHKFMNRKGPLITDSGGFQVFSMIAGDLDLDKKVGLKGAGQKKRPNLVEKITEEGVMFRSYIDGKRVFLTPESSVLAQKQLGADIIIPLDELLPYSASRDEVVASLHKTHRWEKRSLDTHLANPNGQAMYSVIHGGMEFDLRKESIDVLTALPFDGHALGGSLGKSRQDLAQLAQFVLPQLPHDKPNHILGIGDMESIMSLVPLGGDTFDSSYPTRMARHSGALQGVGQPVERIRRGKFEADTRPLMEGCECYTCRHYSRAYIHHLFKANEPSVFVLMTAHNLFRMNENMKWIRHEILNGNI